MARPEYVEISEPTHGMSSSPTDAFFGFDSDASVVVTGAAKRLSGSYDPHLVLLVRLDPRLATRTVSTSLLGETHRPVGT